MGKRLTKNKSDPPDESGEASDADKPLDGYNSVSAIASWIFGSVLVLFLFLVFFLIPCLSSDQRGILRFLMALTGGLFALFFIGGVVLKGKLQDLAISAAGGAAIFVLIQFVVNPFPPTNCDAPQPIPTVSPMPTAIALPTVSPTPSAMASSAPSASSKDGSARAAPNLSEPVSSPTTMGTGTYIPSLGARVVRLQFFESGNDTPPYGQRTYKTRFFNEDTTYIAWELALEHPHFSTRKDFKIYAVYYRPDGSKEGDMELSTWIDPSWGSTVHSWAWGYQTPGQWRKGRYTVQLFIEGANVATGFFEIN